MGKSLRLRPFICDIAWLCITEFTTYGSVVGASEDGGLVAIGGGILVFCF
jgi:hypothetical protein